MPYDLKELAAISGMPGLHRLLRPAHHGVLVESLAERPVRTLAPAKNKVSLLSEISIYTEDPDVTVPLTEVFERIHQQHGPTLPVSAKSGESELSSFLAEIIPDYDRERVYQSDIKKLVTWYSLVSQHRPYQEAQEAASEPESALTNPEAPATAEPTADEPLSTGGIISELDPEPTPTGDPEVTQTGAKKSRKEAE
ncbi:DUF5606 domain-containing protein [uncultured Hymenobacter sp.]|uniref:DUF5606 family protein n=1 Tax=uncultured Hymenobacter sp. TaxID=170016 RepID=UPI0035C9F72E